MPDDELGGGGECGAAVLLKVGILGVCGGLDLKYAVVEAPATLHTAPERREVRAEVGGVVLEVTPRPLGEGVIALGGGRTMMHQPVDAGVGFVLAVAPGESVSPGDALGIVHARSAAEAEVGARVLAGSVRIGDVDGTPVRRALVSARIGGRAG